MYPSAVEHVTQLHYDDRLRTAADDRRAAAIAAPASRRAGIGLSLVRLGARVVGESAVVLAAPSPVRR